MRTGMVLCVVALAGCQTMGGQLTGYPKLDVDTELSYRDSRDRERKCDDLAEYFEYLDRSFDVRRGRAPASSWAQLSDREKLTFAELHACETTDGEVSEIIVEIQDQDDYSTILATYRVENRVDWMKVDAIRK